MTPFHALDHIRQSFNGSTDRMARAGIGQFLTPAAIAQFMASMFEGGPGHVRLLDPGAGLFSAVPLKLKNKNRGKEPHRPREDLPWLWCEDPTQINGGGDLIEGFRRVENEDE